MTRRHALVLVFLLVSFNTLVASQHPRLIIYISIDQMKAGYLETYKGEFRGGFKRLITEGVVYANADLNYAPSETGPGHAALGTGSYPRQTGILSNEWIDPSTRKTVYCVEDTTAGPVDGEGGGFSPANLLVTGLGDWLKKASPSSKVISASIKDRAAILMGGQRPDAAYWYDHTTGHMVTSDYYGKMVPPWVRSFNASQWVQHFVPDAWIELRPAAVYRKYIPDSLEKALTTDGWSSFPHRIPPEKKNDLMLRTPFGDAMILDFARSAVRQERLGQRGVTDLLLLSLSCTDYIGHRYGGNSREMIDQIFRLDKALGDFITDMERLVGKGNILIALSADHGSMPEPEYLSMMEHLPSRRIPYDREVKPEIDQVERTVQKELGATDRLIVKNEFLNYAAARTSGLDSVAFERRIRKGLLSVDGIADVYFRRQLIDREPVADTLLEYYRRGYYPLRGPDFIILPRKYSLITSARTGTSHGTPYRYDTHVPVVFWGTHLNNLDVARVIHSVDIAPTLAALLRVVYPSSVDGVPLKEVTRRDPEIPAQKRSYDGSK